MVNHIGSREVSGLIPMFHDGAVAVAGPTGQHVAVGNDLGDAHELGPERRVEAALQVDRVEQLLHRAVSSLAVIRVAVSRDHSPIRASTVGYIEVKSTSSTGTGTLRIRHSARPP